MTACRITPGPWKVVGNGMVVAGNGEFIADVLQMKGDGPANARVIAASPDLLAALRMATAFVNMTCGKCELGDQCRAAIAKATEPPCP